MRARKLGLITALLVITSTTANAMEPTVVAEHTFDISVMATPWQMSVMVPYYNPADHNGAPLEEMMVMLEGSAKSDVDITANGSPVIVQSGEVGAFITASGLINGLTIDVIPKGVFAPPSVTVPADTMVNLTDISGNDMDMIVMSGSPNVSMFEGTGTFEMDLESLATSSLATSGGNMDASQRTISQSRLTVQYKAIVVPEPASFVCLALGALGLFALRKRAW